MTDNKKNAGAHSKLADVVRLRLNRYMTKGAGAKPKRRLSDLDQGVHADLTMGVVAKLRADVAKVVPKKKAKKKKRSRR